MLGLLLALDALRALLDLRVSRVGDGCARLVIERQRLTVPGCRLPGEPILEIRNLDGELGEGGHETLFDPGDLGRGPLLRDLGCFDTVGPMMSELVDSCSQRTGLVGQPVADLPSLCLSARGCFADRIDRSAGVTGNCASCGDPGCGGGTPKFVASPLKSRAFTVPS